jgi:hypothetical protein
VIELQTAADVVFEGYCVARSRTHPYVAERHGPLTALCDAPRRRATEYRKAEIVAVNVPVGEVLSALDSLVPDRQAPGPFRRMFIAAIQPGAGICLQTKSPPSIRREWSARQTFLGSTLRSRRSA